MAQAFLGTAGFYVLAAFFEIAGCGAALCLVGAAVIVWGPRS